ncbi:MAG: TetR/AcrR family transcriptional regulator [Gammaproteobacteria bacterium]|nr:TetR/AcrR family transcriptional regulator [Gammaproteobacteria bacterium]
MIKQSRKSKEDWLKIALDILEMEGIDAVRVERLAARLHIAKSGFYWHFKNRDELLKELLKFWEVNYTEIVIQELSMIEMDPAVRLNQVAEMIWKRDLTKYDLAIRIWAKHDPVARRTVKKVNKLRMDYIRSVFSELGFRGNDLETRTMLYVVYHSWERPMFGKYNQQKWEKLKKLRLALLTQK